MAQVTTTFPDQTYTSSNKPSADTLKADISAIETAANETDAYSVRSDGTTAHQATMLAAYPVGSVYINATVATNPATLLGIGTWVAWGVGKVIVGIDTSDTDFDTAEETGGAKTVDIAHTHTMVHTHELNHTHTMVHTHTYSGTTGSENNQDEADNSSGANFADSNHQHAYSGTTSGASNGTTSNPNDATTDSQSTNNTGSAGSATTSVLQPYQVGYVWKRTA